MAQQADKNSPTKFLPLLQNTCDATFCIQISIKAAICFFLQVNILNRTSNKESKSISQALKPEIKLYIGQDQIKEVTDTRFLGIQFDPLLNWSTHIQILQKK